MIDFVFLFCIYINNKHLLVIVLGKCEKEYSLHPPATNVETVSHNSHCIYHTFSRKNTRPF